MSRYIPALAAFTFLTGVASAAFGQATGVPVSAVTRQASAAGGRVHGMVRDEAGQALGGVNVVALGTTLAAVRSDGTGRFSLALPPGEYILRATREGYISTFREPVRVQTSVPIERNITLIRQGVRLTENDLLLASMAGDSPLPVLPAAGEDHSHSEMAWRLRHLPRSVLRDVGPIAVSEAIDEAGGEAGTFSGSFRPRRSAFDWAVSESARAATAFFSETDFRGQLNFLTTSSLSATSGFRPEDWPRGVAYVAVGAPVGGRGDWMVRGAMTAGDASSWAFVAEYDARPEFTHAISAGVSYSTQGLAAANPALGAATIGRRAVGGGYAYDRWRLHPRVALEYGVRLDRYDYVASHDFVSPRIGARVSLTPSTTFFALTSRRVIAPGADEFLPPSSTGPWLPPERTFSTLVPGMPFRAERVRHFEVGIEHAFGESHDRTVRLKRFAQATLSQVSTLFGLDGNSAVGHYYVASPGDVVVEGWAIGVSGALAPRLTGSVDYSMANADWTGERWARLLRRIAPSATRRDREYLHDVTAALATRIPITSTNVKVAYRINSAFSAPQHHERSPVLDGRFDIEVRQALPYQPIHGGRLEVVFAARNLLRDFDQAGSVYDELLTVAPPMRLLGGVQVRF